MLMLPLTKLSGNRYDGGMILQKLEKAKLIHPPNFLVGGCAYLTIMGSTAYGVSEDASDLDLTGFCIPPKEMVFPHLGGEIRGFGAQIAPFDLWQEHHVRHPDGKVANYDISIYGIVRYFSLCMQNNPNMIDSLFTPRRCVLHATQIGEHVREHRRLFLHKGAWIKFKSYSYSQLAKIRNKVNAQNPERAASIATYGMDLKYCYHLVRLLCEVEQILVEHDLDLERNREQLKSIRRGEWTFDQIASYFSDKERALETVYANSTLPAMPDEARLKTLLLECLEMFYGSLDQAIARQPGLDKLVHDLKTLVDRYSV